MPSDLVTRRLLGIAQVGRGREREREREREKEGKKALTISADVTKDETNMAPRGALRLRQEERGDHKLEWFLLPRRDAKTLIDWRGHYSGDIRGGKRYTEMMG